MVVVGAKGFASELLQVLVSATYGFSEKNLFFFDNISPDIPDRLYDKYHIIRSYEELTQFFLHNDNSFCLGIGNPYLRKKLSDEFINCGGKLVSVISESASAGIYSSIGEGATIIGNAQITNGVRIGRGCLIYMNTSVTHDVIINDFVEIAPGVTLAGHCTIGSFTSLGAGSIVLPKVNIGSNCVIGAGAVVTRDIPDHAVVAGVPGRIIRMLNRDA